MNKGAIIGLSIAGFFLVLFLMISSWGKNNYNSMVLSEENVSQAWSAVESQYQRRSDLIPNLVEVVKGYAKHESSTLIEVVEARAKATQLKVDPNNTTPEKLAQYQAAQAQVGSSLNRLLMSVEAYPNLKANQNFLTLQAQLEGTENRIATERGRYIIAIKAYNFQIRKFPANILANMFGFEKKVYYEGDAGTDKAPQIKM